MAPQRLARVTSAEAVRAERNVRTSDPARDLIGERLEPIGCRDDRRMPAEDGRDEREPRLGLGVQPIPALDGEGLVTQLLIARDAVDIRADVVFLLEKLLRAEDLPHDRTGSKQRDPSPAAFLSRPEEIDAADDPLLDTLGHRGLRVVLVVEGQVIEDVLTVAQHPLDA